MAILVFAADKCSRPVLEEHRAHPLAKPDLVQVMLTGRDKETGQGLSDANIKQNVSSLAL